MDSERESSVLSDYFLALLLVVITVGLSIAGIVLLVTCEATESLGPFGTTTIGCTYPFQTYGIVFLYAASLVVAGDLFPIHRIFLAKGRHHEWDHGFLAGVVAGLSTILFVVFLLVR